MDQAKLQRLLRELQAELGSAETLDPESRALVAEVLVDLASSPMAGQTGHHATAASRLRESVLRFDSEHPTLATAVRQVADALGKLGI